MLGHADIARRYPTLVTITHGVGNQSSGPLHVSRGFALAPARESTSGVEDAAGMANSGFVDGRQFVNVDPDSCYVDTHRTFVAKAKRLLQDGWSAPAPTTKHASGTKTLRQYLGVNTFMAVISDALQKCSRKALVVWAVLL